MHRLLARGGMAELFLAEATDLPGVRRQVVIKRMLPELARDEGYVEMFLNEARIVSSLSHPNVVQIVEAGRDDGELFLAMEHIEGPSLAALQERAAARGQALPLAVALHIVSSVLSGLRYVHEVRDGAGRPLHLIHRDLSPRNVLLTWQGAVKIIDFGIARASNRMGTTRDGRVRGTVPYMSPEQCRGRQLDGRSDLYSAAILLWELTVGARLYEGESDFAIFEQIVRGAPRRPSALRPGYPAALEALVLRGLALSPAERFASAAEMLDELDAIGRDLHLAPSPRVLEGFLRQHLPAPATSMAGPATGETRTAEATASGAGRGGEAEGPSSDVVPAVAPERPRQAGAGPGEREAGVSESGDRGRWRRVAAWGLLLGGLAGASLGSYRLSLHRRGATPAPPGASAPGAMGPPAAAPPPRAPSAAAPPRSPAQAPAVASSPPAASPSPAPVAGAAGAPAAGAAQALGRAGSTGELLIDATPWCLVSIDGRERGPTPLTARLAAGPHQIRLHNTQFSIDHAARVVVTAGRTLRRRFDLRPQDEAPAVTPP